MDNKKHSASFYISKELHVEAKCEAENTDRSFSKYLTMLIKKDLRKQSMEEPFETKLS